MLAWRNKPGLRRYRLVAYRGEGEMTKSWVAWHGATSPRLRWQVIVFLPVGRIKWATHYCFVSDKQVTGWYQRTVSVALEWFAGRPRVRPCFTDNRFRGPDLPDERRMAA